MQPNISQICRLLKKANWYKIFKFDAQKYRNVCKRIAYFKCGKDDLKDLPQSGPHQIAVTVENVQNVRRKLEFDERSTIYQISEDVGIRRGCLSEGLFLLHDNAPCHTPRKLKAAPKPNGLTELLHPPYSPDLALVVSLAVGWSSFLLLSISSEVSRSLSTTVLSSRTVSEKSNKEPNLLSNPHTFQSHYLDQANHGQWIIPYEYMLYYKWHQLQQQLNNAEATRQLGYQQQRQSINENHIIASSNLKNWGLTREVENIHNEFHKIEQPHDMASLDHAENLSVIMDNSYNSLLDPGLQQHEPNGMLTFHTNGKIKRKQKYAKLLLICGLLSLCTVIFQFLTSFLLLCFVDKVRGLLGDWYTSD
ncbi:unnamed protein product [Orchesella dallaii]|uniref:Uncharacterized protein n=1 Tax=Orchesella dallaii TaxID=48710 RepID=A0ABP1Q2L0_9HEXA